MLEKYRNRQVKIYFSSNSGVGADNGNHGARTLACSYLIAKGIVNDFDDSYLELTDASITIIPQYEQLVGFGQVDLKVIKQDKVLIKQDKIIFIAI